MSCLNSTSVSLSATSIAQENNFSRNSFKTVAKKSEDNIFTTDLQAIGTGSQQDIGEVIVRPVVDEVPSEADVVVIGAGLGGLCCAGLLSKYGLKVVVCESHTIPGGAAHSFVRQGYHFDSGPSFHAGLSMQKSLNPLKQVLDVLGETVECVRYKNWTGYLPEGIFNFVADGEAYRAEIRRVGGEVAYRQWLELEKRMEPLAAAAAGLPASSLRGDLGVALTVFRFLPGLLKTLPHVGGLLKPFSSVVDPVVTDPFLRNLINLECFVLSGMLADSTITAEMAFMFFERNRPEGTIDYPLGGGGAIVDALVRGITKHGGKVLLGTHVEEIIVQGGRATGVRLRKLRPGRANGHEEESDEEQEGNEDATGGNMALQFRKRSLQEAVRQVVEEDGDLSDWFEDVFVDSDGVLDDELPPLIRATRAVVSNASIWDTAKILPRSSLGAASIDSRAKETGQTGSFVHLHMGIDATGLPEDLECHHLVVSSWEAGVAAPQNVCIISIASVFDPSLAPPGKHVVHAYTAGNEPFDIWQGMDRKSPEYAALKKERSQVLWQALERVIPDIRQRVEFHIVGTPLTHARYLRRNRGTYGPAVKAGQADWPGPKTEIPGLLCCGDSTMPGIGVPAVAASGLMAANALLPVWDHLNMLDIIENR